MVGNHVAGTIYFVRQVGGVGPIKIGFAINVKSRLGQIAAYSPVPLEVVAQVPGTLAQEKALHGMFSEHHSHREWFHPAHELLTFIEALDGTLPHLDPPTGVMGIRARQMAQAAERRGTNRETVCL